MSNLSTEQKRLLSLYVNPELLEDDVVIQLAKEFASTPDRYIYFDDFLRPPHLPRIRELILEKGEMNEEYSVFTRTRSQFVDKKTFDNTQEKDQFISTDFYVGPKAGHETSRAVLTDLSFRNILHSPAFHAFLGSITGDHISYTERVRLKSLNQHHFLKAHSDSSQGRIACLIIYLNDGWQPEFKGRFIMHRRDGSKDIINPICNRAVLFDTTVNTQHEVEKMAGKMGDWLRMNYTIWFSGED